MQNEELRERVQTFASLQAAHRALARSVHPSELAAVRAQSRDLLIQLQGLSARERGKLDAQALARVDGALAEQAERTLQILVRIDLAQLRGTIPMLAEQHPDEVRGLVDVLLAGDLHSDKILRTLEYLITMLSADERGGRRIVVREPSHATPRLREVSRHWLQAADADCLVAERVLEDATATVRQTQNIGEIRDRVRRYKEELGPSILHPRVLAAAVAYNVSMWNQVASEIDSSRAIEKLAAELFDLTGTRREVSATARESASDVLGSREFARLLTAFSARVHGESCEDAAATCVVAGLAFDGLRPEDALAFSDGEDGEVGWLTRAAIVVGLVLGGRPQVDEPLAALGIDPGLLETHCLDDLMERMTELARKRFVDSNYGDAFRLYEVKTRSLAGLAAARDASVARGGLASGEPGHAPGLFGTLARWLGLKTDTGSLQPALAVVALMVLLALYLSPPLIDREGADAEARRAALAQVSPFLEWGEMGAGEEPDQFLGRLSRTWDYLGDSERKQVASRIGRHFEEQGAARVILADADGRIVVRWTRGTLIALEPRPEQP